MRYEAYTDGSYKEVNGIKLYASAAIIAAEGTSNWTSIVQCGSEEPYVQHRNVAGEVFAVMQVCEYCLNTLHLEQGDLLRINHDYVGIPNWLKNPGEPDYWRCKKELSKLYREYMYRYVKPRFQIEFNHTPGHSGIRGNELVDELARDAIDKQLAKLLSQK